MNVNKEIMRQEQIASAAYEEFERFRLMMEEKRSAALRAKRALNDLKAKVYFKN